MAVAVCHLVGQRATGSATQAGADGRTGATAKLIAQYRATRCAQASAQCRFGLVA